MRRIAPFLAMAAMVAVVIPMAASAAENKGLPAAPKLTIRIYDYARIPNSTLVRAIDETRTVFRRAGIEARLVRCRVALTDPVLYPCHSEPTGPSVIQVRVLPEAMASMAKLDKRVFGFAMTAMRPDYGVIANVFYHRVKRLASEYRYRSYNDGVVLGYVLAHEAGHLLLGSAVHSKRGIMRMLWQEAELFAAHQGHLAFTPEQSARIRRDAEARIDAQRAKDVPEELLVGAPGEVSRRSGG